MEEPVIEGGVVFLREKKENQRKPELENSQCGNAQSFHVE